MPDVTNDSLSEDIDFPPDNEPRPRRERDGTITEVGNTSGGGSLGHDQSEDLGSDTDVRNAASDSDPVMPSDDSSLNTKI